MSRAVNEAVRDARTANWMAVELRAIGAEEQARFWRQLRKSHMAAARRARRWGMA